MFRIDTNKTWFGRYCTGDIVFAIANSAQLRKKNFKPSREKWIFLKLHKPANTTLSCQKAVEKTYNNFVSFTDAFFFLGFCLPSLVVK